MSFDELIVKKQLRTKKSQSLWNRAMSFDDAVQGLVSVGSIVSIPLEQGNVFRQIQEVKAKAEEASQSLWNRAMSFDVITIITLALL